MDHLLEPVLLVLMWLAQPALYIAEHPGVTPSDLRTALRASGSVPSTACDGKGHGYFTSDRDSVAEPLLYMASGSANSATDTTPPAVTSPHQLAVRQQLPLLLA